MNLYKYGFMFGFCFAGGLILNVNISYSQFPNSLPGQAGPLGNQGGDGSFNWMGGLGGGAAGVVPPPGSTIRGGNDGANSGTALGGRGTNTPGQNFITRGDFVVSDIIYPNGYRPGSANDGQDLLSEEPATGGGGGGGSTGILFTSSGNLTVNVSVAGGDGGRGGKGFHIVDGREVVWGYGGSGGGGTGVFFAGDTMTVNVVINGGRPGDQRGAGTDEDPVFRGGSAVGGVGIAFAGKKLFINNTRVTGGPGLGSPADPSVAPQDRFNRAGVGLVVLSNDSFVQIDRTGVVAAGPAFGVTNTVQLREGLIVYGNNNRIENSGRLTGGQFVHAINTDMIGQANLIAGNNNILVNSGIMSSMDDIGRTQTLPLNAFKSRIANFQGSGNTLEIQKGYRFEGTEIFNEGSNNTFKFGGTQDDEYFGRDGFGWDLEINGFQHYLADAPGATWSLGYKTTESDTWTIDGGTLRLVPDPQKPGTQGDLSQAKLVSVNANLDVSGIGTNDTTFQRLQGNTTGTIEQANKNIIISSADGQDFQGIISGTGDLIIGSEAQRAGFAFDAANGIGASTADVDDPVTQIFSNNNTSTGTTRILPGQNLQLGNGGTKGGVGGNIDIRGTLTFNRSDNYEFINNVSNSGNIVKLNTNEITINKDELGFTGTTKIRQGAMIINGVLGGSMNVEADGTLAGSGTVGPAQNRGTIAPGLRASFSTLTVNGDYTSSNGKLVLNTRLGDDNSLTDRLKITGSTSGTTNVTVNSILPGNPALTRNGILVVDVGGQSAGGFILDSQIRNKASEPVVVSGAFAYALRKNGAVTGADGNWYLQSTLPGENPNPNPDPNPRPTPMFQPGVPLYAAENEILRNINRDLMSTMYKRIGNRYWTGASSTRITQGDGPTPSDLIPAPSDGALTDYGYVWLRMEGWREKSRPSGSAIEYGYTQDVWNTRLGIDGKFYEDDNSTVIGSVWTHLGASNANVGSDHGDGKLNTNFYGIGGALTWFGYNDVYIDLQAQGTWYETDMHSTSANLSVMEDHKSTGIGTSIEVGKRIQYDSYWSFTPQAQLVFSSVNQKGRSDSFNAWLGSQTSNTLTGRAGVSANYETAWQSTTGFTQRLDLRGFVNILGNLVTPKQFISVSDFTMATGKDNRIWGEVGVGATYNWNEDKYSIYGNVSTKSAFNHAGSNNTIAGAVGFRAKW